jgi:hypothetical protein
LKGKPLNQFRCVSAAGADDRNFDPHDERMLRQRAGIVKELS